MISRYKVYLNDIEISSLDDSIYVHDISYGSLSFSRNNVPLGGRSGTYSGNEFFTDSKVTVSFYVRQYDTKQRQSVVQSINNWCRQGGWLKVSDRPDQKMYVKCSKPATIQSVLRWTDTLSLELVAYDYPFWVDEVPQRISIASGDEWDVFVPGNWKTDVEAVIVPSETMTGFTIECGDTTIELDDLSIPADQPVTISYTEDRHILSIESGGVSLLDKRTPESNDDLVLNPGNAVVYFDSGVSATCTLIIKGVYL